MHDPKFSLPGSKINHFKLQGMEYLLQLSHNSNCKYHCRIWRMRSYFLLARYLEKQMEREQTAKIVYEFMGDKFKHKKAFIEMFTKMQSIPIPRITHEIQNLREVKE